MRGIVWAVIVTAGGLAHAAPALKDRPKTEPGLAGDWEVVELTMAGQPIDLRGVHTGFRFTADGRWGQVNGSREPERLARFTVDPATGPASLNLSGANNSGGPVMVGIYRLDGDTLTLCLVPAGSPRPTEFTSAAGTLYQLLRITKGD
jgi:uncharacterized protein (TIGR03067 family)